MIRFACGTCKERLVVPDRHAGRKGKCPRCGTINRVPAVSEFEEPTPSPDAAVPAPAAKPAAVPSARLESLTQTPPAPRQPAAAPLAPEQPARPRPAVQALEPAPAPVRSGPGLLDRLLKRFAPAPSPKATDALDSFDAGGIPSSFRMMFVIGVLVLVPLLIGAAFVVMILLRVKLGE